MEQLPRGTGNVFPDEEGVDRLVRLGGQLAGLADQLERDGMNPPVDMVDVDRHPPPRRFVDGGGGRVLEVFDRARGALLDADAAHLAGRVDRNAPLPLLERAEGAERRQRRGSEIFS